MKQTVVSGVILQMLILGYGIYAAWDIFTLLFVYIIESGIAALFTVIIIAKQHGWVGGVISFLISVVWSGTVGGMMLFAATNIFILDQTTTYTTTDFLRLWSQTAASIWPSLLLVVTQQYIMYLKKRLQPTDVLFSSLSVAIPFISLIPTIIFGGFISIITSSNVPGLLAFGLSKIGLYCYPHLRRNSPSKGVE